MPSAVPKFASFRPKSAPPPQPPIEQDRKAHKDNRGNNERQEDERRSKHSVDRRSKREHDDHFSEKRQHENSVVKHGSLKDNLHVQEDLFVIDRQGDEKNLAYGSLHRYSIPQFHRTGYGNVLGLELSSKIDRDISSSSEVVLRSTHRHNKPDTGLLKGHRQKRQAERLIRTPALSSQIDVLADFVSLSSTKKRKRGSDSPEVLGVDYRSIEGKQKASKQDHDSDVETASDSEEDHPEIDTGLLARKRNAELSNLVKRDTSNSKTWTALIQHQAEMVNPGKDYSLFSNAERTTLADMRLSIYQNALKAVRKEDKEQLLLGMLQEGSKVWDSITRQQKWLSALQETGQSSVLLMDYLNMLQNSNSNFRYEEVKQKYMECLKLLRQGEPNTSHSSKHAEMQLHVLLRMTRMMQEAGYEELSIAIWQALVEYHCFRPSTIEDENSAPALFERFWDDEEARFGEQGAKGWDEGYTPVTTDASTAETGQTTMIDELNSKRPFGSFAEAENASTKALQLPGKTLDEEASEDPFHVILFSDLRDILQNSIKPDQATLTDALLTFFCLPPLQTANAHPEQSPWRLDPLVHRFGPIEPVPNVAAFTACHPRNQLTTTGNFFSDDFFPSTLPSVHALFLNRGLQHLVARNISSNLDEYLLAFQAAYFPTQAPKTAKTLLKVQTSSLRLYNAAALIEARQGRPEKASKIWEAAVGMAAKLVADGSRQRQEKVLLVRSWVWFQFRSGRTETALRRLMHLRGESSGPDGRELAQGEVLSLASRLGLQRAMQEGFENALHDSNSETTSLFSECLALLSYLTSPNPLPAALDAYNSHCAVLESRNFDKSWQTYATELLHQSKAELISYHISCKRAFKPAMLRQEIEESLSNFPNNTSILSVYRQINQHSNIIDDKIRSAARSSVVNKDGETGTLISWAELVCHEIDRFMLQSSGSTAESVRSTFSRTLLVLDSPVAHSPSLWYLWFEFERYDFQRHMDREKGFVRSRHSTKRVERPDRHLKQVFLDGLRFLPWDKSWILLGLETFDPGNSEMPFLQWASEDLKRVFNLLIERELRVRVDGLEDLLDDIADSKDH